MNQPPFDLQKAHRWFAVECNNAAWDLVEADSRTPEEAEKMLHLAHAALLHWAGAGNLLNRLRALNLLAMAYLQAGIATEALRYATACVAQSDKLDGDPESGQTAFDRAGALACLALALAAGDDFEQADALKQRTLEAAAAIESHDDRKVFAALYGFGEGA